MRPDRIGLTFDCADAVRLAAFWKLALGYVDRPPPAPFATNEEWLISLGEDPGLPEDGQWLCDPDGLGPAISLLRVPEPKTAKNRMHIDLNPDDREAEVERLVNMGARRVDIGQGDVSWVTLADPDGNEFDVLKAFTNDAEPDG
jgi:hypothetical protein